MGIEQIVFILLIVFALLSIFANCLKYAIICTGVFGLWVSFAYLLFHAPDVAVAEAVIASSLGTILYIITIKKYNDITIHSASRLLVKGVSSYILLFIGCILVIFLNGRTEIVNEPVLFQYVMENYFATGQTINPVGNIYLNYRIFDTILEALMLLLSGVGVVHLLRTQGGESHEKG